MLKKYLIYIFVKFENLKCYVSFNYIFFICIVNLSQLLFNTNRYLLNISIPENKINL